MEYLSFEKPIEALAKRAAALREGKGVSGEGEAEALMLDERAHRQLGDIYARLTPWQKTQVARHPSRPHFRDYVARAFTDFMPLGGDRKYGEDHAIVGGFATLEGRKVMLIGHEKGHDTQSRIRHNFGMGKPEGYRKAIRLMEMASRYGLPVVTLVDTSGAFPGVEAEERGQAEAIARSTEKCLEIGVPLVAVIVGEGGSGGAVALASANRVLMLEHAVYSVISPEGCASILWRGADRAPDAAEAMKMTAPDLMQIGVIHRVIYEPIGGAHRNHAETIKRLGTALRAELQDLTSLTAEELRADRWSFFMKLGSI